MWQVAKVERQGTWPSCYLSRWDRDGPKAIPPQRPDGRSAEEKVINASVWYANVAYAVFVAFNKWNSILFIANFKPNSSGE